MAGGPRRARENGRASWPVQAENLRHEKAAWPSGRFPCCAECRTEMEVRERGRDDITAEWQARTELGTWDEIKFGGDAAAAVNPPVWDGDSQ